KELQDFWKLMETAGRSLYIANSELADRAGLGTDYFVSVARDRRRPKIANFLKALTAIIDVSNERLSDVENTRTPSSMRSTLNEETKAPRLQQDHAELLILASSLAQLARAEIARLDIELPNDPTTIEANVRQRELLT